MALNRRTMLQLTGAAGAAAILPGAAGATPTIDTDLDVTTDEPQEVLVTFESADQVGQLDALDLADGYHAFEVLPIGYTRATGTQLKRIAGLDGVRQVEPNRELEWYNDDARGVTESDYVQDALYVTGGSSHVAVIDSGVDGGHRDLTSNLVHNYRYVDPLSRDTAWVDAGRVDTDDNGHGTHCSGTVCGTGAESDGKYKGHAPDASLTVYSTGAGLFILQSVAAFDHLLANHADEIDVTSNSYGPTSGNDADFNPDSALAVATWHAYQESILSVFAAGNSGPGTNTLSEYAKAPYVLGVAATNDDKRVTDFSSRGRAPSYDGGGDGAFYDRKKALRNYARYRAATSGERTTVAEGSKTATVGPGVTESTTGIQAGESTFVPLDVSAADGMDASVSWPPTGGDVDVYVHAETKDGPVVADAASLSNPETLTTERLADLDRVVFELVPYLSGVADATIDYTLFTTAGRTPDGPYGIYRPGVATPGESIVSTMNPNDPLQALDNGDEESLANPWYAAISGTSMACPAAAGIAALVIDAYARETGSKPAPIDVITTLEATAEDVDRDYAPYNVGAGFVNARSAVEAALDGKLPGFGTVDLAEFGNERVYLDVTGSRADDGSAFTAGQTNQVDVTVDDLSHDSFVTDTVPPDWTYVTGDASNVVENDDGSLTVEFREVTVDEVAGNASTTFTYFVEAPEETGTYTFGPARAHPDGTDDDGPVSFGGTDDNTVAGVDQNTV